MPSDQISQHFSFGEMTRTDTGLANVPNAEQGAALVRLCDCVLEPMRALCGPLQVDSGFRSEAVNTALHGAHNSQHMLGQAADVVPSMDLAMAFKFVRESSIPFDQLILEPSWIHISCAALGAKPRRDTLLAIHTDQGKSYVSI